MRRPPLARWSAAMASLAVALLAVSLSAAPASAITNGELDGDGHPFVGFMLAKDSDDNPLWVCTGTMLSPTVYLTAGHCTQEPAVSVDIWFDPDLTGLGAGGAPLTGDARGIPHTHPDYDPRDFTTHDVGVVVLEDAVDIDEFGTLPTPDQLDSWQTRRGQQDTTFTAVGYGVQKLFPDAAGWKTEYQPVRMVATPRLVQMNTPGTGAYSLLVSANANTGGECRGDSGGPNFLGSSNVIGGISSYDPTGLCRGVSGIFRMDRASALDWVQTFLPAS